MKSELENYYFKPDSLWKSVPKTVHDQLKSGSTVSRSKKGDMIYSEGAFPKGLYIINKGSAKLFVINNDGREQIIFILSENELFGHRPILGNDHSPVFVSALEDCEIEMIGKDIFLSCINKYHKLSSLFLHYYGNEFRILCNRTSFFTLKTVTQRVSLVLLILNEKFKDRTQNNWIGFAPVSHKEMANYSGVAFETFSRELRKLREKGIIHIKGWNIKIINLESLMRMADIL